MRKYCDRLLEKARKNLLRRQVSKIFRNACDHELFMSHLHVTEYFTPNLPRIHFPHFFARQKINSYEIP